MLEIENLSYPIDNRQILQDLNLKIEPGNFFALAGENGAGKSTLIKIVLDLIRNIEQGKITLAGMDHRLMASRKGVAYLPEKFDVKKEVTGWQYLKFIVAIYGQSLDRTRIAALCEQLSFDEMRLKYKTSEYSKGMKQKLGLISCFMLDNPLIILDEPLSGLDPKARFHFKELLKHERTGNRTIFYSTHLLADAEEICDQFGILHHGRIIFEGSPSACLQQFNAPTLEQAYMNCISGY